MGVAARSRSRASVTFCSERRNTICTVELSMPASTSFAFVSGRKAARISATASRKGWSEPEEPRETMR